MASQPSVQDNMTHLLRQIAEAGVCRGCSTQIFWVRHKNGRLVPYTAVGLNHFVDCPAADRFRRSAESHGLFPDAGGPE